jgi:hypothetical protein
MLLMVSMCAGCATTAPPPAVEPSPPPKARIVAKRILVTPKDREAVPKGRTIVIADIEGPCAQEVKTALMKRLVDNADYSVVTRDNLRQIVSEADQSWAGKFNSDTAAKLGELMGASLWVVGRVANCGPSASDEPDNEFSAEYKIIAVLQVIEIETGKVLVASASEGSYTPRPIERLQLKRAKPAGGAAADSESSLAELEPGDAGSEDGKTQESESGENVVRASAEEGAAEASEVTAGPTGWKLLDRYVTPASRHQSRTTTTLHRADGSKVKAVPETVEYVRMRAADEMASGFADKFFRRPQWEEVVMWNHPLWRYSEAAALVHLGHCPRAVRLMDEEASQELPPMTEEEVAQYLHNYGVALLCANEPKRAAEKLRSAYRISPNQTTLNMLGLAGRIVEWSLAVEVDQQPEIEMLLERDLIIQGQ